jgi:hypothetical protein
VPSNLGLGDTLQDAKGIPFLVEDRYILNAIPKQGLAELEPGNVAVQIGRTFRGRKARQPSRRYQAFIGI